MKLNFLKNPLVVSVVFMSIGMVEVAFAVKFKDVALPAIETGQSRVFIYRTKSIFGGGMRSPIYLNGFKIGQSKRGTIGYLDLAPGKYAITTEGNLVSDNEGGVNFALISGQTLYVKIWLGGSAYIGRTNVSIIDSDEANEDIPKLKFVEYEIEEGGSTLVGNAASDQDQNQNPDPELETDTNSDTDKETQIDSDPNTNKLKALVTLRDDGIISEAEFQKQKAAILARE